MPKLFQLLLLTLLFLFIFVSLVSFAQTPCGTITDEFGSVEPIVDCANPFGPLNQNPQIYVFFGDTEIIDGGTYPFLYTANLLVFTNVDSFGGRIPVELFCATDNGYTVQYIFNAPYIFTATGTYTMVVEEFGAPVLIQNPIQNFSLFSLRLYTL